MEPTNIFIILFGIAILVLDVMITGIMMLFPFGVGLIVFGTLSAFTSFEISAVVSAVVTIALFIWAYYFSRSKELKSHVVLDIIGKKGKIINKTKDGDFYIAKIGTEEWLADSEDKLAVGDSVRVERIDGVKAIVKKN